MKKFILIAFLFPLFFISCQEKEKSKKLSIDVTSDKETDSDGFVDRGKDVDEFKVYVQGTDFLTYFYQLYKKEQYEAMLHLTSKESIGFHGKEKVLNYYKNSLNLHRRITLDNKRSLGDNKFRLNYDINSGINKEMLRIDVIIENDVCKLILPKENLKNYLL